MLSVLVGIGLLMLFSWLAGFGMAYEYESLRKTGNTVDKLDRKIALCSLLVALGIYLIITGV